MWNEFFGSFTILFSVFLIASTAGLFAERSGVTNIGINGMMISGALTFALFGYSIHKVNPDASNWWQLIGFILAMMVGALFGLLHGFASISLKADQVIVGMAINVLTAGIALFVVTLPFAVGNRLDTGFDILALDAYNIASLYLFLAIILIIVTFIFFRYIKVGVWFAATGENPNAVDAVGISVVKMRYAGICISGALAALSGSIFTFYISSAFLGNVAGSGYIALAIMIFGQWRIQYIAFGAALFSFLYVFAFQAAFLDGVPEWIKSNGDLLKMLPFIMAIVTMVIFSKTSNEPKALAQPFDKSKR
ncbi:ABC transporter permease [Spiroplasma endosymbiont of Amphibalanus improvisus]|uniref:ABC transporter permease n=1 Tax=Spiroplasma endosymbiont of Amphibalanus improvisus TaxID=3066327 RepID=UPI00313C2414